jgi:hypothetical protein
MTEVAKQLSSILFNAADFLALPFEKEFRPETAVSFAADNWPLAIGIVSAYLIFITAGSKLMDSMKPFNLRIPLAGWNAFLCLFSFLGMCRTMPYLLASVISQPYDETVCTLPTKSWGVGATGFWVMLFIFSKIPELIDTVFIVLRKKPLIFLHWYHHVTVLLFCWSAYSTMAGSGLYFVAMNYSVHALMYGYYCLQALGVCPKSFPAILITMSQILQMFVGTGVCISCWYYKYSGKVCANETSNLIAGALMYGSYLYLFMDFAVRRYAFPQKKGAKKLD